MVFVFYPYRAYEKKEQRKSMPSRQSGMSAEVSTRSESGLCDAHWQNDLNLSRIMPVGNTKIFTTSLYIYSTLPFSVFEKRNSSTSSWVVPSRKQNNNSYIQQF